jgi:hypothetical protein
MHLGSVAELLSGCFPRRPNRFAMGHVDVIIIMAQYLYQPIAEGKGPSSSK